MLKTLKTATLPHSRRDFLGLAIQGSAVAAAATLLGISAVAQTKGQIIMQTTTSDHYKPRSASAWAACRSFAAQHLRHADRPGALGWQTMQPETISMRHPHDAPAFNPPIVLS